MQNGLEGRTEGAVGSVIARGYHAVCAGVDLLGVNMKALDAIVEPVGERVKELMRLDDNNSHVDFGNGDDSDGDSNGDFNGDSVPVVDGGGDDSAVDVVVSDDSDIYGNDGGDDGVISDGGE